MLNIDQFMDLPDREKVHLRCTPRSGPRYSVDIYKGDALFCARCGTNPEKSLGPERSEVSWCFSCYRLENIESTFSK